MRHCLSFLTALVFALTVSAPSGLRAEEPAPNIILILTDDHGWSQLSALMDPEISESRSDYLETPNLARIMDGGMRFTSGYSPAPLCTPTRRSILCGTTAARSGSEFKSPWVPAEHLTIPRALKQANADYRCAHFGKWGEQMISTPEESGYDASDGMTGNNTGGMPSTLGVKGGHGDGPPHFIDNENPKLTKHVTDQTISFLGEQAKDGTPFYIQASYYAQHLSVVCREETLEKYKAKGTPDRGYTRAWAAMLEELDDGVGRILDALDEHEITDNTYVFFTADNGGRGTVPGGDTERTAPNYPLTGAKHSLYEGGTRVPFFAVGPGIEPGSVCRTPVAGYDFLATFHALAGGEPLTDEGIDSVSFKDLLFDPDAKLARPGNALYFHRPGKRESTIRKGKFKLRLTWNNDNTVAGRELYQVEPNPVEEGNDLAGENPAKADALQNQLLAYLESVDAEQVPPPRQKKKGKGQKQ